jgi:hypothetical protein
MSFYLKQFFFIFLPVVLLVVGGGALTESIMKKRLVAGLHDAGFTAARVGDMAISNGYAYFAPVAFDKDSFSSAGDIRIRMSWPAALLQRPFRDIHIDDLTLAGDIGRGPSLNITGWKLQKAPLIAHLTQTIPFAARFGSITLKDGRIELATPGSALTLQAKGQVERDDKAKGYRLHGSIACVQHELQADSAWNGTFGDDGTWGIDMTLGDSRFDFGELSASRVSGWLSLKRGQPGPGLPAASGQFDAGRLEIGRLAFSDLTLTLNGPLDTCHILFSAAVPSYPGMHIGMDIRQAGSSPVLDAAIETDRLEDLMAFLRDVRDSRGTEPLNTSMLMPLLLTEGNLKRLEAILRQTKFDKLELEIAGPLDDLTGKIIAKTQKKNGTDRHVVSLDPGDVNGR